jgi:uncharacterized protein DUF1259
VDSKARIALPAAMEVSDVQPLDDHRAIINGDVVMTAGEITRAGIQAFSLHNHLLYERPLLFYLHYWAAGDGARLARSLRSAVAAAHAKLPDRGG